MKRISVVQSLFLILALMLVAGCNGGSTVVIAPAQLRTTPLDSGNLNLIFVVSPDLNHPGEGDINTVTTNLSNKGLQRSLLMATFLKQQVLGGNNVTGIYTLAPMTHLQTAFSYPDMAAIEYVQQFAQLNQTTMDSLTTNSFPLNASYAAGTIPGGVAQPVPACPSCQGLYYNDTQSNNTALVNSIVTANIPGYHVFSAPWETISAMMTNLNRQKGYNLNLSTAYMGPNYIQAISITPAGAAGLFTYNSNLTPPTTYPVLPAPLASAVCPSLNSIPPMPQLFTIPVTGGSNGAVIPAGINTNQTVYLIRHAEAHPIPTWDDGNYVAKGQWRALALPNALQNALRGKPTPTQVYSVDPAQVQLGASGNANNSYVRPSLTVAPYAIANNLPYFLVSDIEIFDLTSPEIPLTRMFFFFNPKFNNQTLLVAWEHSHFAYIINDLLASYYPPSGAGAPALATNAWPETDYDTIWTVTLDAQGNLTVTNALCEGIDSTQLPPTAPQF